MVIYYSSSFDSNPLILQYMQFKLYFSTILRLFYVYQRSKSINLVYRPILFLKNGRQEGGK